MQRRVWPPVASSVADSSQLLSRCWHIATNYVQGCTGSGSHCSVQNKFLHAEVCVPPHPSPSLPQPWQLLISLCLCSVAFSRKSHGWNRTVHGLCRLVSLTKRHALNGPSSPYSLIAQVHLSPNNISQNNTVNFRYTSLSIHSPAEGHLGQCQDTQFFGDQEQSDKISKCRFLFGCKVSVHLDKHQGAHLLSHRVWQTDRLPQ